MDARNQIGGYALVNLPAGITAAGSIRARSGFPIDATANSDLNGDGNFLIPGVVTSGNGASTSDRPYTAPGVSMKRNAYRNRAFKTVDLRLLKSFPFGEDKRVEFSAEMFNLFNFDNIVYDRTNLIYGPGIVTDPVTRAAVAVPAPPEFLRLRLANGKYDPVNNQLGTPFQAQFGL